jgi:uncharacterized membrane protein|tara:strand:+ start:1671 stop:2009 length:339 start_codon:yes stop_codon:yes gene_type:complete
MKLWIIILFLIPTLTFAQSFKDGIVVVQYSADFVKANEIDISKLEGADLIRMAMTDHPKIFEKENIKFLPTVCLYHNRKLVVKVESDISLKLPENTLEKIQEHINKIVKSKF